MTQIEIILVAGSIIPLAIYHLLLIRKIKKKPEKTACGITSLSRKKWVVAVIKHEKDILAIQTMRNWTMAATFLASTAILIGLGLMSMVFNPGELVKLSQLLNLTGSTNQTLFVVKLLLLVLVFFTAFFNFTLSIRHYNHAATMINIPLHESMEDQVKESILMLNFAARYYTFGMRCFYFSIPLALWLFGPLWMFFSSWILILTLSRIDRSP